MKEKENKNNILTFQKRGKETVLSDKDINSLFLGLVNIVKKSCFNEVATEINSQIKLVGNKLLHAEKELIIKQEQLNKLEQKNLLLTQNLLDLRLKVAEMLSRECEK